MNFKYLKKQYKAITPDPDLNSQARISLMKQFENNCPDHHTSFVDDLLRFASRCVRPAVVTINTILVIGVITFGLYMSSANAAPGNFLYPVKLSFEKARINILAKESSQNALRAEVLHKRLSEAEILAKKLNADDTSLNAGFDMLAQSFVKELDNLKRDIKEDIKKQDKKNDQNKVVQGTTKQEKDQNTDYFPDDKLLSKQNEYLPVADGKEVHPFNNTNLKEFQKIVSDIKESLKNKDMQAALNQIEKAQDMVSVNKNLEKSDLEKKQKAIKEEGDVENNKDSSNAKENNEENSKADILQQDQGSGSNENVNNNDNVESQDVINDQKEIKPIENTASLGKIQNEDNSGKVDVQEDIDFQIDPLEKNPEIGVEGGMSLDSETE